MVRYVNFLAVWSGGSSILHLSVCTCACFVLKVAAGTLDASTKIYAVRVDAVHADAYRVLGGLGAETKPGESESLGTVISCHNGFSLIYTGAQMQVLRVIL